MALFVIKTDGPLFYINQGNEDMARKAILKVYSLKSPDHAERVY